MEYYLAIKRNTFESVLMKWMNLEPILQSEFCYRDKYHILTHSSVQPLSCVRLQPHGLQHTRPPCPSPTPGVYSNSSPLSRWRHPTILSFDIPFSSCLQSFPVSGTFPVSQFFPSGDQSIGVVASASVLPINIWDWFPLGWTGWISLQSKELSSLQSEELSSLLQYHSSKASIRWRSAFFIVQLSHPYMTSGKTITLLDGPLLAK